MQLKEIFPGIFLIDSRLYVKNLIKDFRPFGEQLVEYKKTQYSPWDPQRSKLAAAIVKGLKEVPIKKAAHILYLGAAHGYTCSKIASIVGEDGIIYAIEFSERCFNELLPICEKYKNIVPILADARKPEDYNWIEQVDIVYEDVAQPDATEIAIRNCKEFLKPGGYLFLAIKTQSIDVTAPAKKIVEQEVKKIGDAKFEIIDIRFLEPFEEKHAMVIAQL